MTFRLTMLSDDGSLYALSVWADSTFNNLLLLYTGNERTIKSRAKELNYDIGTKLSILKRHDYKLNII